MLIRVARRRFKEKEKNHKNKFQNKESLKEKKVNANKIKKKYLLKFLIKYSGNADSIAQIKSLYEDQHGREALDKALAKIPSSAFQGDKGSTSAEAIYFNKPDSSTRTSRKTKQAMSKGAKLRPKPKVKMDKETLEEFQALNASRKELNLTKVDLAKNKKGFKQGGLAGTGHNEQGTVGVCKHVINNQHRVKEE